MEKEQGIEISNLSASKETFLLYGLEKWFSTNEKSDIKSPVCKRGAAIESLHLRRKVTENIYHHCLLPLRLHNWSATPGRPADI